MRVWMWRVEKPKSGKRIDKLRLGKRMMVTVVSPEAGSSCGQVPCKGTQTAIAVPH